MALSPCDPRRHTLEKIDCDADHRVAMEEIERLADADADSEDGRYRDSLLTLVAQYESKGKPFHRPG